jgi:hypothetical protein
MSFDPGDVWQPILEVRDPATGNLTSATVTVLITAPDGTTSSPAATESPTGTYTATVPLTQVGKWTATWTVSGAVTGVETQAAYVRRLGSNVVSVADVKRRLDKTLTVDDAEIEEMIDAAIAEYEQWVGPVSGTVTETHHGGGTSLILRNSNPATIVTAVYSDGTTIDTGDLDLDTGTGILYWGYGTAGYFNAGARNVTVTYTVGDLPANHRETIAADVAGYFAATQQGPNGPDDDLGYAAPWRSSPTVMFPRIRALAAPAIA